MVLRQQLGSMFGGITVSKEQFVCSTVRDNANDALAQRRASVAGGKDKSEDPSPSPGR